MCGIVGLFMKTPAGHAVLGQRLSAMLAEMSERGPDSAGFAVYGEHAPAGRMKATFFHAAPGYDWGALGARLDAAGPPQVRGSHATFSLAGEPHLDEPGLRLMSLGERIEIFKEMGRPDEVIARFGLDRLAGSHALAHTRMATESAVTTEHSHPFSTGLDLCLVHNGSLSNHNRLRRFLERRGIRFTTDNDTEVAAGYLTWRLREGASLEQALEAAIRDLDGFYTFAVGTRDGFAILRDPIACKPAVMAETDDWVAMASEYRAIARLPDAAKATVWEPRPGIVYAWGSA